MANENAPTPDYTAMSDSEMYDAVGADAAKWAAAFCQHAKKIDGRAPDEGWMISWFANAIEHSHYIRTRPAQSPSDVEAVNDLLLQVRLFDKVCATGVVAAIDATKPKYEAAVDAVLARMRGGAVPDDEATVERVAKAIFETRGFIHDDDKRMFEPLKWAEFETDEYQPTKQSCRDAARAAIAALNAAAPKPEGG